MYGLNDQTLVTSEFCWFGSRWDQGHGFPRLV